ncbi:hypothetical protein [Sphingobium phenoxybenzoativorans]|uniref:hypothetical protein n=1 Tax=Sphingobium phenoxybenzoativorans TaxID=1592790 RepID=UPI001FE3B0D9|nr:hypothetical protein [Sphingobium phenoxybenzoativorans]
MSDQCISELIYPAIEFFPTQTLGFTNQRYSITIQAGMMRNRVRAEVIIPVLRNHIANLSPPVAHYFANEIVASNRSPITTVIRLRDCGQPHRLAPFPFGMSLFDRSVSF